jgi:class 3 adenylate cyclase
VEVRLAQGEHAEVIDQITALVLANPLRERPRRLLMLALYRAGRHAEALAAYRDAVAALDEIGLQPGPELRKLEEAILRHDEALRAPGEAAEPVDRVVVDEPDRSLRPDDRTHAASGGKPERSRVSRSSAPGRRKVITALFCDVTGSTALGEELDPEALHDVMNRCWPELRAVIERHGGTVDKFVGDAVMAVFGIPQVREDDALRAVRAAAEIRQRLPAVAEEIGVALRFRAAVNTGLVLVGDGENLAIGDAVNVAASLGQSAAPGEILLGEQTLGLVRDAVEVEPLEPLSLKGKSAVIAAFRVLAVDPRSPGLARRLDRPLVGRERELGLVRAAWDRTVRESGCHLFTLLGAAGVGKSRLVAELLASVTDIATVLPAAVSTMARGSRSGR